MEPPTPIYLQPCCDCGRPALTRNQEGKARCAEHAAVFIPEGNAPGKQSGPDEDR